MPIDRSRIPVEIIAGVTLAAVAIPEVLGYSKIAGMPVITGLYTILIPLVLFVVFGSSRHLAVGADSATAAILAAGLVGIASTGSDEYVALASVLALMAAAFVILARIVGLGFMADFLSRSALVGFLTGVGLQVALGQISGMLGLEGGGHGTLPKIWNDFLQVGQTNPHSLAIAVTILVCIVGLRKISKKIPVALIAVVGAILVSWGLDLGSKVDVVGSVPGGLPHFGLPQVEWTWSLIEQLVPTAFAMFVVILTQSAATSRAYAARYNERFSENDDLVGLGIANIGAGLTGTFVVNGSPTKTDIVDSAGGRSQLSLLVTSVVVLLVLLFLTGPLAFLPEAVLATIVFLIGIDLIDFKGMRKIFNERRAEFWIALLTAVTVVFVGIEQGIVIAIVVSLIDHTRRGYRPRNVLLATGESGVLRAVPLTARAQALPGLMIYRFSHSLYYANAERMSDQVTELIKNSQPPIRWLCIDASGMDDVDFTGAETLRSIYEMLKDKGIRLVFSQVTENARTAGHYNLMDQFGKNAFYETNNDVLAAYENIDSDPGSTDPTATNLSAK